MSRLRSFTLELNPPSDFGPLRSLHEDTVKKILTESNRMARKANVDSKQEMHIVLLTEEMISVLPHLMEYGSGKFWIDSIDDVFEIHILVTPKTGSDSKTRKEKNSGPAKRTMMSRVLDVFDKIVSRKTDKGDEAEITSWSLGSYIEKLRQQGPDSQSDEWDEMEHSILANLADDVMVRKSGGDVDLVIIKKVQPQDFSF